MYRDSEAGATAMFLLVSVIPKLKGIHDYEDKCLAIVYKKNGLRSLLAFKQRRMKNGVHGGGD